MPKCKDQTYQYFFNVIGIFIAFLNSDMIFITAKAQSFFFVEKTTENDCAHTPSQSTLSKE